MSTIVESAHSAKPSRSEARSRGPHGRIIESASRRGPRRPPVQARAKPERAGLAASSRRAFAGSRGSGQVVEVRHPLPLADPLDTPPLDPLASRPLTLLFVVVATTLSEGCDAGRDTRPVTR